MELSFCALRLPPFEELLLQLLLQREPFSARCRRGSSVSLLLTSCVSFLLVLHIRIKATIAIHIAMTAAIKAKSVVKGMTWDGGKECEVSFGEESSVVVVVENN